MRENEFAGVILAGGKSSRFGSNKALAEFHNRKLIEHPAKVLEQIFKTRLLVTNTPGEYEFLGWPMTGDIFSDKGPLAGIHAALTALSNSYIFVTGCDMPSPNSRLISYLCEQAPGFDAVIPVTDMGLEPLHGVYARSGLAVIEKCLLADERKIRVALGLMKTRKVELSEMRDVIGGDEPFRNINTPSDLDGI